MHKHMFSLSAKKGKISCQWPTLDAADEITKAAADTLAGAYIRAACPTVSEVVNETEGAYQ